MTRPAAPHPAVLVDVPERFETARLALRRPQRGDGKALWQATVESLDELRRFPASEARMRFAAERFRRGHRRLLHRPPHRDTRLYALVVR